MSNDPYLSKDHESRTQPSAGDRRRLTRPTAAIVISSLVVFVSFVFAAAYGAQAAARDERVLAQLDPWIDLIRSYGSLLTGWSLQHGPELRRWVCGVAGGLALVGLILGRLRAVPLVLLAVAVALAVCGQTLLLEPEPSPALWCYVGGLAAALLFGILCPSPPNDDERSASPRWWIDGVLVTAIALLGLGSRFYALTELPSFFAGEMSVAMVSSRTLAGMQYFVPSALLGTSIGVAHMFPQMAFFNLFGTSVYSLRLTALAIGLTTIVLMYWLLRSLGGRRAAVIGALLMVTAPEQLWWGRDENVNYIMVCFAGVVTASLGWWLRRRLSVGAALAVAAWLPFGRFFYLAAVMLVTYPWLLVGHALIFTRGAWRRLLAVIPVLAVGTVLWVLGLSIVNYLITDQHWHFLNPVQHGELVSRRDVEGRGAGPLDLVRKQAASLGKNISLVASAFTYRGWFSQWYQRADSVRHPTWINVAVSATVALSAAYVLGQLYTPQASVLLSWLLIGLLPAILSTAPDDRRLGLTFPALYACAGFAVHVALRVVRQRAGRIAAWLWGTVATIGLGLMMLSSASSHFSLPTGELALVRAQREAADIFRKSDAIYFDGDPGGMLLVLLGHLDDFLTRRPCMAHIGPREWLSVALRQPCSFDDAVFQMTHSAADLESLRATYRPPQRVSFVFSPTFRSQPALAALSSLFPGAQRLEINSADLGFSMIALRVERSALEALRRPTLRVGEGVDLPAEFAANVLAGATVQVVHQAAATPGSLSIQGGFLVEREDWYRFTLTPACDAARLSIDDQPLTAEQPPRPLLAGVHSFEIDLAAAAACSTPLHLVMTGVTASPAENAQPPVLVSPGVADLPRIRAPQAAQYDGYTEAGLVQGIALRPLDARATPDGGLLVLLRDGDRYRVQRLDADGNTQASWEVAIPAGTIVYGMAAGPAAETLLVAENGIWIFAVDGSLLAHWPKRPFHTPEVAFLPDGRIAAPIPEHAAIEVFRRDGSREQVFNSFAGGTGKFVEPNSIALSGEGDIVVGQTDGTMLLFRTPLDRFEPQYVRQFRMDFTFPSVLPRSLTFDGPQRIMAGDPERLRVLVHTPQGVRLVAHDAARDWGQITRKTGEVRRFVPTEKYMYVLGAEASLRRFTR